MAGMRKSITLDEKIEKAQEAVEKAKARYTSRSKSHLSEKKSGSTGSNRKCILSGNENET